MKKIGFLFILCFILVSGFAQQNIKPVHLHTSFTLQSNSFILQTNPVFRNITGPTGWHDAASTISGNYYQQHLGFFCQVEWKIEKETKIPFRFRLGSLAYTDYLEGKDK
jgi:hypothetical protein